MRVADLGEFNLIRRLTTESPLNSADLLVGIGDDAAVWESGETLWMATTDTMVDGVHFLTDQANPLSVGWKAGASNASDINAMGGTCRFALITLGLPTDTAVGWTDALYHGLHACGKAAGFVIAGGDIVRSDTLFVSITIVGSTIRTKNWQDALLLRSVAETGDIIAVSGNLGGAAGGLEIRLGRHSATGDNGVVLLDAHDRPHPPFGLGSRLVSLGVRCGLDLSDGLAGDCRHIAVASGKTLTIDATRLPIHPSLVAEFADRANEIAIAGGEDYNLLFTCSQDVWTQVQTAIEGVTAVGTVSDGPATVHFEGASVPVRSWDHLA